MDQDKCIFAQLKGFYLAAHLGSLKRNMKVTNMYENHPGDEEIRDFPAWFKINIHRERQGPAGTTSKFANPCMLALCGDFHRSLMISSTIGN